MGLSDCFKCGYKTDAKGQTQMRMSRMRGGAGEAISHIAQGGLCLYFGFDLKQLEM